jgi:hypothetical protein
MPVVKVALDTESFKDLAKLATEQRRPITLQAEVLLLKGLGRWDVSNQLSTPPATSQREQEHAA